MNMTSQLLVSVRRNAIMAGERCEGKWHSNEVKLATMRRISGIMGYYWTNFKQTDRECGECKVRGRCTGDRRILMCRRVMEAIKVFRCFDATITTGDNRREWKWVGTWCKRNRLTLWFYTLVRRKSELVWGVSLVGRVFPSL